MKCTICENNFDYQIEHMFEYAVCRDCITQMKLFQDKTIKRYYLDYKAQKEINPEKPDFREEMNRRLAFIEKDYIKKKIKLKYILERLDELES